MNRFLLSLLALLAFIGFTALISVTNSQSFLDFASAVPWNSWIMQITADLYIACTLVAIWIWHDARRHGWGLSMILPFYAVAVPFASMGLLLYFIVRNYRLWQRGGGSEIG